MMTGGYRIVALEGRAFGRLGKLAIVERSHLSTINKITKKVCVRGGGDVNEGPG